MRRAILRTMEHENRREKYQQMRQLLNEKQWRQLLAWEAKERGSIVLVAREAGVSKNTIKAGRRELEAGDLFSPGKRIRGAGGGRKKQEEHDASLQADLEALLDPKERRSDEPAEMDDEKCGQAERSAQAARPSTGRYRHPQATARAGLLVAGQQEND